MWVDVDEREHHNYMTQTFGSLIPGYTGHCPLLKFKFGKCYGDNTRQIMREIRSKGLFKKPLIYRPEDNAEINAMNKGSAQFPDHYNDIKYRGRSRMTGYTGYVPGLNFRYGKSYGRAVDDSMQDFNEQQRVLRKRAELTKHHMRSRSAPKMESIHTRDEIRRELNEFEDITKFKGNTITSEFPPIAGYTGHIPRIKGTEASLSQRYHCAAKRGLELIQLERENRKRLQNANENIQAILKEANRKHSYWNWG